MDFKDPVLKVEVLKNFFKQMLHLAFRKSIIYIQRNFSLVIEWLFPFYFSLFGLALLGLFFSGYIDFTPESGNLNAMLVTCAAILGSFVALASTLSILPIQNSMVNLTPLVRTFLNRDLKTQLSFASISFLTIFLLVLSIIPSEKLNDITKFIVGILLMAVSLDLIRLYQRSVLRLMEPGVAIALTVQKYIKYLLKCRQQINDIIRMQVSDEDNEANLVIRSVYQNQGVNNSIKTSLIEIAEISRKAVKSGDLITCEKAIDASLVIFSKYLEVRQDSLSLIAFPNEIGIYQTSDVQDLVILFLERLKTIHREAIANQNENVCQKVIKAHGVIGSLLASISIAHQDREESVPDISMVLAYMEGCVTASLMVGMDDVVLDAGRAIQGIARSAKRNVRYEHFYGKAIRPETQIRTDSKLSLCALFGQQILSV